MHLMKPITYLTRLWDARVGDQSMSASKINSIADEMGRSLSITAKLNAILRLPNEDGGHCMTKPIIREAIEEISRLRQKSGDE